MEWIGVELIFISKFILEIYRLETILMQRYRFISVVVPYCSCCLCLYFGSAIMIVTYFVNFR